MTCIYFDNPKCLLLSVLLESKPHLYQGYCQKRCGESDEAKRAMLKRHKIELETIPQAVEELQTKIAAGEIKTKPACGNCGKIKNIVAGFGKWAWDSISGGKPDEYVVERAEICAACDERTFLSVVEWSARFGVDLTKVHLLKMHSTDLPIDHEPGQFKLLYCAKCKCSIGAKIRVKEERCPLAKWEPMKPASA